MEQVEIKILVHGEDAVEQATALADILKEQNLRGVSVAQPAAEPERGALSMEGYQPLIELLIDSGLATVVIKGLFESLSRFFIERRKIEAEKEVELKKLESEERIRMAELEAEREKARLTLLLERADGRTQKLEITAEELTENEQKLQELLSASEN